MTDETLYLKCRHGDIAPLVLLSGDPARVERAAELVQDVRHIRSNREYSVATGAHRGVLISMVSGGIGAPSTAIAIQELAQLGARVVVRVGTNMGVQAPLRSVVLSTGAARFEGTSNSYLPLAYPAIPDYALVQALAESGRRYDLDLRLGLTATYDAFYPDMAPSLAGQGTLDLKLPRRAGVLSMDMETSLVFTMGMALGLAVAAMCLVTVQAEPHTHLDHDVRADLELCLVQAALDGLAAFGSRMQAPPL
jgi:uridine phosphorylase